MERKAHKCEDSCDWKGFLSCPSIFMFCSVPFMFLLFENIYLKHTINFQVGKFHQRNFWSRTSNSHITTGNFQPQTTQKVFFLHTKNHAGPHEIGVNTPKGPKQTKPHDLGVTKCRGMFCKSYVISTQYKYFDWFSPFPVIPLKAWITPSSKKIAFCRCLDN